MEVLGYLHLHSAIEFESSVDDTSVDVSDDSRDRTAQSNGQLEQPPRSIKTSQAGSSHSWMGKSSLYLSALLCSVSIIVGTAPIASAVMRYGDSGADVVVLQKELAAIGFFQGQSTGYFGEITKGAVMDVQRANGLVVDGIVGPETQAALRTYAPTYRVAIAERVNDSRPVQPVQPIVDDMVVRTTTVRVLSIGTSGPEVLELQRRLTIIGVYQGPIDGYFGPETQAALIRFQEVNGLLVTGVADSSTQAMLNRAVVVNPTVVNPTVVSPRVVNPTVVNSTVVEPVVVAPTVQPAVQPVVVQPAVVQPAVVPSPVQPVVRRTTSPPATIGSTNQIIYRGDSGAAVRSIQENLARIGIYDGPITGYYGSLTEEAVYEFQLSNGIEPTGVAGPVTLQALSDFVNVT